MVPEILFNPEICGIKECGVAEAAARAMKLAPTKFQVPISRKIILCGGCVNIQGFKERFVRELATLIPETWKFKVFTEADGRADLTNFRGAVFLANSEESLSQKYTRAEYIA